MRSSNTGTCTPTGERYKPYRGIEIDGNLDIDIMDALNAILGIGIVSTCAGHHAAEENATLPCPHVTLVIPHESAPKVIQALRDLPDTVIERTHDWFPAPVLTSVVVSATIAATPENLADRTAWWHLIVDAVKRTARLPISPSARTALHRVRRMTWSGRFER